MEAISQDIFVSSSFRRVTVGAILTELGWVLVDTPPYPEDARRWRSQLARHDPAPIYCIVNTDHHRDRILGNYWFDGYVVAHRYTADAVRGLPNQFIDQAVDALVNDDTQRVNFAGIRLRPPNTSFNKRMSIKAGSRDIPLLNMSSATPGSTWVHLPEERIVFTGDSVVIDEHPYMADADTKAWLETLTNLRRTRFTADVVVPGRGPYSDKEATNQVSDYIRLARRRVQHLYKAGRPRADTVSLVPDLIDLFPSHDPEDVLQRRIKSGLDHIYEGYKAADAARTQEAKK